MADVGEVNRVPPRQFIRQYSGDNIRDMLAVRPLRPRLSQQGR